MVYLVTQTPMPQRSQQILKTVGEGISLALTSAPQYF